MDKFLAFLDLPNTSPALKTSPTSTQSDDRSDAATTATPAGLGDGNGAVTAGSAAQRVLIDPAATTVTSASANRYSNKAVTMNGYHYPRAPRNLSQESAQSLHASHDKDILYHLIDRLVRLKHMDLELARVAEESENNISFEPESAIIVETRQKGLDAQKHAITERRKAFITACNQDLHVKDVTTVLYAAEMGVCALNANILNTDIDTTSDESGLKKQIFIDEQSVLSDVRQKLDKQIDASMLLYSTKKFPIDTETVDKTGMCLVHVCVLVVHNM